MFFLAFLNTIKIILENSILKYGLKRMGTSLVRPWSKNLHLKQNVKIGRKVTELCQLDGRTLKLAYFRPKIDYFGDIFKDIDFKFVLLIYIKIDRQTKLEVNRTKNNHLASKKPHKWPYLNSDFFQCVRHSKCCNFGYN